MKTFLVLSALLLSGCAAYYEETRVNQAKTFCVKAGFTLDTPEFRECMLRHYEAGAGRGGGGDGGADLRRQGMELMRQGAPQTRGVTCTRMGSTTYCN